MTLPLWVIVVHFFADWYWQTDWMALNKSKNWWALADHVTLYSFVMVLAYGFSVGGPIVGMTDTLGFIGRVLTFGGLTWCTHFITDAITSRITAKLWFFVREDGVWAQANHHYPKHGREIVNPWTLVPGKRHNFFVMIGFDQVVHYVTLALTLRALA